jgi:anti-sigma regulatory factor (Ser/Thr protein kinase)
LPASTPDYASEVPLNATALEAVQDSLAGVLESAGVAGPVRYRVRLAVEELVANLIMHGRFAREHLPARITLRITPAAVLLQLDDAAEPFDPRQAPAPVSAPTLEEDALGGLGLPLVRKMAEIQDYRRLPDGWNRTELLFPRGAAE